MAVDSAEALFKKHRDRLFGLAYRMTGSVSEAEDLVQETFVKWLALDKTTIDSAEAWLIRVTTNLALDTLKSARVKRQAYIGPWLPEPLAPDPHHPERELVLDESVTMALMVVLERLTPAERAVFILHDLFRFSFEEVASLLGKTNASCRQLASRARKKMGPAPSSAKVSKMDFLRVVPAFWDAIKLGDFTALSQILKDDVVLQTDGGGKAVAAKKPIYGVRAVSKFLVNVLRPGFAMAEAGGFTMDQIWFNGAPGWVIFEKGLPISAFSFHLVDGRIQGIHVLRNPDKLKCLPLGKHPS